jgi:DNA-binding CsgD family transcriptional regulator
MQDSPVSRLTDNQRACLLFVLGGATSKEIAPLLGLTFRTVDQYIHEAQQALRASARREAARAFASSLDEAELKRLQLKFPALVQGPSVPSLHPNTAQEQRSPAWGRFITRLLPPPIGGQHHDLKSTARLSEMLRAALFMAIFMIGLVLLIACMLKLLS